MKCTGDFLKDSYSERNMRFGIREFGMGAVSNALSLDKTGGGELQVWTCAGHRQIVKAAECGLHMKTAGNSLTCCHILL